jgi:PAS domain S-box-containing protein
MVDLLQTLANTADGAFVIDEHQRITFWNETAQQILGYTPGEVIGQNCYEILGGQDDKGRSICCYNCQVTTAAQSGETVINYDSRVRTKSGETCWINISILTFSEPENNVPPMVIHLFRDATQKKQNEEFIRQILDATKRLQKGVTASDNQSGLKISFVKDLTGREREVLSLLVHGLNTRDIAHSLSISPSTARNHIQNILHKLQVHSRLEAVAYALEHGFGNSN